MVKKSGGKKKWATVVGITIIIIPTNNFLGGKKILKKVEKNSGKKKWG